MTIKLVLCAAALCLFATTGQAQYLRAGAQVLLNDGIASKNSKHETDWTNIVSGMPVTATSTLSEFAAVDSARSAASAVFTAGFGQLKGYTYAGSEYPGIGQTSVNANGSFSSFSSFTGAGFNDQFTVSGDGAIVVTVEYRLHSVQSTSGAGASTYAGLDVFSYGGSLTGIRGGGAIQFESDGNRTESRSYSLTLQNGDSFYVNAELAAYSILLLNTGAAGFRSAETDASHTGAIFLSASGGTFRSTSGYSYAATPVPEPGTVALLASGLVGLVGWRRRRQA